MQLCRLYFVDTSWLQSLQHILSNQCSVVLYADWLAVLFHWKYWWIDEILMSLAILCKFSIQVLEASTISLFINWIGRYVFCIQTIEIPELSFAMETISPPGRRTGGDPWRGPPPPPPPKKKKKKKKDYNQNNTIAKWISLAMYGIFKCQDKPHCSWGFETNTFYRTNQQQISPTWLEKPKKIVSGIQRVWKN